MSTSEKSATADTQTAASTSSDRALDDAADKPTDSGAPADVAAPTDKRAPTDSGVTADEGAADKAAAPADAASASTTGKGAAADSLALAPKALKKRAPKRVFPKPKDLYKDDGGQEEDNVVAEELLFDEWQSWQRRHGKHKNALPVDIRRLRTLNCVGDDFFKMRYTFSDDDGCLTRWFGLKYLAQYADKCRRNQLFSDYKLDRPKSSKVVKFQLDGKIKTCHNLGPPSDVDEERQDEGVSPLLLVRAAAAVLATLLLAVSALAVLFVVVLYAGCPPRHASSTVAPSVGANTTAALGSVTTPAATASTAASTAAGASTAASTVADTSTAASTTTVERACKQYITARAWTNCTAGCGADDYAPLAQVDGEPLRADGGTCLRALWKACYGAEACWSSPSGPDNPPARLDCASGFPYPGGQMERFYAYYVADQCDANTSYCYVFKPYDLTRTYYGCYKGGEYKIEPLLNGIGCGLSVPADDCRVVAANVADKPNQLGRLCCCTGNRCNYNKTLAHRAVNETSGATCSHGFAYERTTAQVASLDDLSTHQDNCTHGGICIDYAFKPLRYQHERGCDFGADRPFKGIHFKCAMQLGKRSRTCFTTNETVTETGDSRTFGVCCCRGDNCTADNAVDYLYNGGGAATTASQPPPCDLYYALLEGAPDSGVGGDVQLGCATAATRVPAAALDAACERVDTDGCFVTHDAAGTDVSVCCCGDAPCSEPVVRGFVANRAPTTTQPSTASATTAATRDRETATTTGEATTTTTGEATTPAATTEAAAAAGGCAWPLWALGCLLTTLALVLLVALAVAAHVVWQFRYKRENERWKNLLGKVQRKPKQWEERFRQAVTKCAVVALKDEKYLEREARKASGDSSASNSTSHTD